MKTWTSFIEWWYSISAPRRAFRRWLFRRMFPDHRVHGSTAATRPVDRQQVVILDSRNRKNPIWIAEYDASNESYSADGGWFEPDEIDYWVSLNS